MLSAPPCQAKFFRTRKFFFDLAKSPDKKRGLVKRSERVKRSSRLASTEYRNTENCQAVFFEKIKTFLSNKNRYLQAHCLQVPEKIEKNKLRKEDKK